VDQQSNAGNADRPTTQLWLMFKKMSATRSFFVIKFKNSYSATVNNQHCQCKSKGNCWLNYTQNCAIQWSSCICLCSSLHCSYSAFSSLTAACSFSSSTERINCCVSASTGKPHAPSSETKQHSRRHQYYYVIMWHNKQCTRRDWDAALLTRTHQKMR